MVNWGRDAGSGGAETVVSGEISIFSTWTEDIYFFNPDGTAMDLTGLAFHFQFRGLPGDTSADLTLSTADGTLSIATDDGAVASILRIEAEAGAFDQYEGDMIADLVAVDQNDFVTHYAHGVVTFTNSPVAV